MKSLVYTVIVFVILGCVSSMEIAEQEKQEQEQEKQQRKPFTEQEKQEFRCMYCDLLSKRPDWCQKCD